MSDDTIIHDDTTIVNAIRSRQGAMRKVIDDKHISLKVVAYESGVPYTSLLSYFPDPKALKRPAQMPLSVLFALCGHLPEDILSLLLPTGHVIVRAPEELNHDEIADCFVEYLAEKQKAHYPESECGPAIGPGEHKSLTKLAVIAGGKAAA